MKDAYGILCAGLNLAIFRRVDLESLKAAPGVILLLAILDILIQTLGDFLAVGFVGEWNPDGLPGQVFPIALMLVAATFWAEATGSRQKAALMMAVLLSLSLPLDLLKGGFCYLPEILVFPARMAISAWWLLSASVALVRLNGLRRRAVFIAFTSLAALVALPLTAIEQGDGLWASASNQEQYDKKYDALTGEANFYIQPKLLETALGNLSRQGREGTELFFLGLAGDAEQGVFLREVKAVETLMKERFGVFGHTLSLINNYQSAGDYPLASVTALGESLKRLGEVMDRNNDILFLFISSHGSPQHEIVLDFWPLRFNPLNPEVLKRVLDDSGIYWRVVVISACYSGGFIEPLRNDHTIVITAAAPDRSSFGCSDENDWTYFGKAFFDQALRHESDLAKAFEEARGDIARREHEEQVDIESDPKIFAGPAMVEKWRSFIRESAARR